MDLADYIKLGLKNIHKPKIESRPVLLREHRQIVRNDIMAARRRINDSPLAMSPALPKKPSRLELLKKWQLVRDKRKADEKLKQRPLFKVYHLDTKEDVGKIYSETKNVGPSQPKRMGDIADGTKPVVNENVTGRITRSQSQHAVVMTTRKKLNFKQENLGPSKIVNSTRNNKIGNMNVADGLRNITHVSDTLRKKPVINPEVQAPVKPNKPKVVKVAAVESLTKPSRTRSQTKSNDTQLFIDKREHTEETVPNKCELTVTEGMPHKLPISSSKEHLLRPVTNEVSHKAPRTLVKEEMLLKCITNEVPLPKPTKSVVNDNLLSIGFAVLPLQMEPEQIQPKTKIHQVKQTRTRSQAKPSATLSLSENLSTKEDENIPTKKSVIVTKEGTPHKLPRSSKENRSGNEEENVQKEEENVQINKSVVAIKEGTPYKSPRTGKENLLSTSKIPRRSQILSQNGSPVHILKSRQSVVSMVCLNGNRSLSSEEDQGALSRKVSSDGEIFMSPCAKSMSPDFPVDNVFYTPLLDRCKSDEITPVKNEETPTYVSPYVTMSRGKTNARKEFKSRQSNGGVCVTSPDITGGKAGSTYFYRLLDNEIAKIHEQCCEWNMCKDGNNLPEEATNVINVAIGQSGLLVSKRMQQFRGLIDSCAAQNTDPLITCQDLHGYRDLLTIQIKNLESRFENLKILRSNNWDEVISERKPIITQIVKRIRAPRKPAGKVKQSSLVRDAIRAAKLNAKAKAEHNIFEGGFFMVKSPRKSGVFDKTPSKSRLSLLKSVLTADVETKFATSPGMTMMKVTRSAKSISYNGDESISGITPAKSILKVKGCKSSLKTSKAVLFLDDLRPDDNTSKFDNCIASDENDINSSNIMNTEDNDDAIRRSSRLSRNKLF